MKRKKIKLRELLNIGGGYELPVLLEVLNWMLRTGNDYTHQSGWYREGVDKQIFGYSANNHQSASRIELDKIRLYFLNAIIAAAAPVVEKWRSDNGISLEGHVYLSFNPSSSDCMKQWNYINSLQGRALKKAYYHPDYPDRVNPYIRSIKVFSVGCGIEIGYDFTFDCHPGGGWLGTELRQLEAESISDFLDRAVGYFSKRLLTAGFPA